VSQEEAEGWANAEHEEAVLRELLVPLAQARLEIQIGDIDASDSKGLNGLGLSAAAIGVIVAVHDSVNHLWPIPVAGLVVAGAFFFWALWPRQFEPGVDLREFYDKMSSAEPVVAHRQMFAELIACEQRNNKPLDRKVNAVQCGIGLLILSLIGLGIVALARPSDSTKPAPKSIKWEPPCPSCQPPRSVTSLLLRVSE
jgi:hypothetical protein